MTETPNPHIIDADTLTGGLRPIRRVVLSLGSNVGDREANLQGGLNTLADTPELDVVAVSPVYETENPDDFGTAAPLLSAIVLADSTLPARSLLERALAVEDAYGRERSEPGAPRTLDVDLITVGDRVIDEPGFQLPHAKAYRRAFVVLPWAAIEPDGALPGHGQVADLVPNVDASGTTKVDGVEIYVE